MGVAVQSHWFSVGSIVTWAEAGVGAIATQSFVDPGYGQRGLELLKRGVPAPDALQQLVAADAQQDVRQVAIIDAQGRVAAHTGAKAIAAAGHHVGDAVLGAGEPDGQREGLAGDGRRPTSTPPAISPIDCSRRSTRRSRSAATSADDSRPQS